MYVIENKIKILREVNKYKIVIECSNCGSEKEVYKKGIEDRKNMFCSVPCKWEFEKKYSVRTSEFKEKLRKLNSGKNNPNFGNKWTKEQRLNGGKSQSQRFLDPAERWKAGKANRGKWKTKDDYDVYSRLSNWVSKMFDIVPNGISLLKDYGTYNAHSNLEGVSRDHKYSVREGFNEQVFPELLRHPFNCKVMQFKLNASKNWKCSLTKEELFEGIISYKGEWFEQELCEELVKSYRKGNRYNKEEYIKRYE